MVEHKEKFLEYYNNWKKQTQFIYEGHFENKWYKKIIEEIDPKTILVESYKIICHHDDWIAYAIEEIMLSKYNRKIIYREKENDYIPLADYCRQIKNYIRQNLISNAS